MTVKDASAPAPETEARSVADAAGEEEGGKDSPWPISLMFGLIFPVMYMWGVSPDLRGGTLDSSGRLAFPRMPLGRFFATDMRVGSYGVTTAQPHALCGVYNSYVLYAAAVSAAWWYMPGAWFAPMPEAFARAVVVLWVLHVALSLAADQHVRWSRKVCLRCLVPQLRAAAQLWAARIVEYIPTFTRSALLYAVVRPVRARLSLLGGGDGRLYFLAHLGMYASARVGWLVFLLWRMRDWDGAERREPFVRRELNLATRAKARNHVLWSWATGFPGSVMRVWPQLWQWYAFEWLYRRAAEAGAFGATGQVLPAWALSGGWFWAVVVPLYLWVVFVVNNHTELEHMFFFYKSHRAMHESHALYCFFHAAHHFARLPVPLDSGTISAAEFTLTESDRFGQMVTPDWVSLVHDACWVYFHLWDGHYSESTSEDNHVGHHISPKTNFGIWPQQDNYFKTLVPFKDNYRRMGAKELGAEDHNLLGSKAKAN